LQVFPDGQLGDDPPSACSRGGTDNELSNMAVTAIHHRSFFTMQLLCEGFAPW